MPGAAFALPARLDQAGFHQAVEHGPGVGLWFLGEAGGLVGGQAAILPKGVQQQFVQAQVAASTGFLGQQPDKVEVRLAAGENTTTPVSLLRS